MNPAHPGAPPMRPPSLAWMLAVLADAPVLEGLGSRTRLTFQASASLLVGMILFTVPLVVAYGTMFGLSKLAGRIRRGRPRR